MSCDNDGVLSIFAPVSTATSHIFRNIPRFTFFVLKTASFVSLEVSLISAQSCFWCFLSSYLPRGRLSCLVSLSSSSPIFLSLV